MFNNKGFMSLIAIFVTTIVLIIAVTIIELSHMNALATNASINGKQAFYLAEGKIHLCMYKNEYYKNEVIPRLRHYMLHGNLKEYKEGNVININQKYLNNEDSGNKVNIEFFKEDKRLKAKLIASSKYREIYQKVVGVFYMINKYYEMRFPILSLSKLPVEESGDFQLFCNELTENIKTDNNIKDMTSIEGSDYEKVIIKQNIKFKNYIASIFKKRRFQSSKKVSIINNNLYLILRQHKNLKPKLEIKGLDFKEPLNGIIYVQGDIVLYDNVKFCGIIIIEDGSVLVKGEAKPIVDGLIILKNYKGDVKLLDSLIDKRYSEEHIYKYGPLLPNFIKPELYLIKNFDEF